MRPQNPHMPLCLFHAQLTQSEMDSLNAGAIKSKHELEGESSLGTKRPKSNGTIPPSCQLELHLQRTEQPYERLVHHIKVTGIEGISIFHHNYRETLTLVRGNVNTETAVMYASQNFNLSVGHVKPVGPHVVRWHF